MKDKELSARELYRACRLEDLLFQTTEELKPLDEVIGQPRAIEAMQFGVDIHQPGYNIFAFGPPGTGKQSMVLDVLRKRSVQRRAPEDWCYVYNFEDPHQPKALSLPAGQGRPLRQDMRRTVEEIQVALAAAFDSDQYRQRRQALAEEIARQQEQILKELQKRTRDIGLAVVETGVGIMFMPLNRQGKPLTPEQVEQLPDKEREAFHARTKELSKQAREILEKSHQLRRELRKRHRELDWDVAAHAVEPLFAELGRRYDFPKVKETLQAAQKDVIENYESILSAYRERGRYEGPLEMLTAGAGRLLQRYDVNVIVEHDPSEGAPVHYEDNPTYANIAGRLDYSFHLGALLTDFTMIKPGALHKANGGYLVLDAQKVLMQPMVWDAMKRALRAKQIRIETLEEAMGLARTGSLDPEPIPMDIKVVLTGSPMLYHLLRAWDPEFSELFKVPADFGTDMDRTLENQQFYAQLIGTLAKKDHLLPLDRRATARVIEHGSRLAGDAAKLSIHIRSIADLLHEAHYWASHNGRRIIETMDVQRAIQAQEYRSDRLRERLQQAVQRGLLLIDTEGARIGQVNGLSVFAADDFLFGMPSRITARVRMGKGEVIDIEREVELGQAIHSKGVLILSGYLAGRYAKEAPLSLSASLVFEQSYGMVEGDSASLAELCALLSAIAELPVRQTMAVTGSINQHGHVQPVGAVNEKIEGFFDVCARRGLNGDEAVLIPAGNITHLMLRQDVLEAVAQGKFHVHAVQDVDEAIELLTGLDAARVHEKVQARLEQFARERMRFGPDVQERPSTPPRS